jgi:putative restriction endonuclease
MQLFVGITDRDWFEFLRANSPDEVNFWRPGGTAFKILQPGEVFPFKPHCLNYVIGGGFFSYFTLLPASFVWSTFGTKNGARTLYRLPCRTSGRTPGQSDTQGRILPRCP